MAIVDSGRHDWEISNVPLEMGKFIVENDAFSEGYIYSNFNFSFEVSKRFSNLLKISGKIGILD